MSMLRCQGLRKNFGGVAALANVTLAFEPATIVAIVGPNGAGKTTLLNVLTGFEWPDAGRCYCEERETTRLPPHRLVALGVARTFQRMRLIGSRSARENVMLAFPGQRGEGAVAAVLDWRVRSEERANRKRAAELLGKVGLDVMEEKLARELSYGQQKLLALAVCLATGAQTLLLDEPVAGVHPDLAMQIVDRMQEIQAEGKTIIFIEHDLDTVRLAAQRVVVMDAGAVIADGLPDEVLKRPEVVEAYLV